ncbi:MAG: d(CMP) kinase [Erythrobacter sp.]
MIIAVDGPTASGKGTIARAIAEHFGFAYLDTGLLYRAVGRQVELNGGDADNADDALIACDFHDSLLDDPELRNEVTGNYASKVSVHAQVRKALFKRQREFAEQDGGAVLDGRDIGTVVAPDADAKFFITASLEARSQRRWQELVGHGRDLTLKQVKTMITERDARDMNREDAPLVAAPDAMVIDTTAFTKEQAIEAVIEAVYASRK